MTLSLLFARNAKPDLSRIAGFVQEQQEMGLKASPQDAGHPKQTAPQKLQHVPSSFFGSDT